MAIHSPREKWSSAYTANVSIGQGYDLVTPLQLAMVYATVANGGVSYYPRLVDKVETPDGSPARDGKGQPIVSPEPRVRSDLRSDFTSDQIELARKGLWKVVNDDGGTGSVARLKNVVVAGKTGTAQATDRGREGTAAWFACFAPFDQPKYVVVVMVEAGEHGGHGGSVAGPIAARMLEQIFAMDEGKYSPEIAWLAAAHKPDPFQTVKAVTYHDSPLNAEGADQEGADDSQDAAVQMARDNPEPDVEPEADAQGRVRRAAPVRRAQPVQVQPVQRPNFFQRLFGVKRQPAPQPTPVRRRRY
jgi:penicillin-binding protein 2